MRNAQVDGAHGALYRWVTLLTGSKNAVKGLGFFVGALLFLMTLALNMIANRIVGRVRNKY